MSNPWNAFRGRFFPRNGGGFRGRLNLGRHSFDGRMLARENENRDHRIDFPHDLPPFGCHFEEEKLQVGKIIGIGSFGEVRIGTYLGHKVAVKTLQHREVHDSPRLLTEIAKEASIIEQKRSEYIVRLLHYSPEKKQIVTEYCANGSLYEVLRRNDLEHVVQDWNKRLRWMANVALGMNVVHNQHPTVLHRDLKSSNIFICEHFTAKVGDFGLSKPLKNSGDFQDMSSEEQLRMVWHAPEVRKDGKYSKGSDVYSFGIVMHEMLLLKGPYGFTSSLSNIDQIVEDFLENGGGLEVPEDRSELPGRWHSCLEAYVELMHQCCAKEAVQRPGFENISERLEIIRKEYSVAFCNEPEAPFCTIKNLANKARSITVLLLILLLIATLVKSWIRDKLSDYEFLLSISILSGLVLIIMLVQFFYFNWESIRNIWCNGCTCFCIRGNLNSSADDPLSSEEYHISPDNLSMPSPFERGFPLVCSISDDQNSINLLTPSPAQWGDIREGLINELGEFMEESFVNMHHFCSDHTHGQLTITQWETFVKLLAREPRLMETKTWKKHCPQLAVPIQPPGQVEHTQYRPVDGTAGPSTHPFARRSSSLKSNSGEQQQSGGDSGVVSGSLPSTQSLERTVSIGIPAYDNMNRSISLGTVQEVSPRSGTPIPEVSPRSGTPIPEASPGSGSPVPEASPGSGSPVPEASPRSGSPVQEASPRSGSPVQDVSLRAGVS